MKKNNPSRRAPSSNRSKPRVVNAAAPRYRLDLLAKILIGVLLLAVGVGGFLTLTATQTVSGAKDVLTSTLPSGISVSAPGDDEITIGTNADAPAVTIYTSLTCPHCKRYDEQVVSKLEEDAWLGRIRLVLRDHPRDQAALFGAGLVRCYGGNREKAQRDLLLAQNRWAKPGSFQELAMDVLRIPADQREALADCATDNNTLKPVLARIMEAERRFSITATPTTVVGDQVLTGTRTVEEIRSHYTR